MNLIMTNVKARPHQIARPEADALYCLESRETFYRHVGETMVTCGLVVEQRTDHQITCEPMKFLTLADWTGRVETELFAQTYKSYGLATVRYPVLEVTATVEPSENGRGCSLRVLRVGKPRSPVLGPWMNPECSVANAEVSARS